MIRMNYEFVRDFSVENLFDVRLIETVLERTLIAEGQAETTFIFHQCFAIPLLNGVWKMIDLTVYLGLVCIRGQFIRSLFGCRYSICVFDILK